MRYEILGPLNVVDEYGSKSVSSPKIELLLTALLARPDNVVSTDMLITELWGDRAPRNSTSSLYVYISQLRKFLSRDGRLRNPVVTRHPGYLLEMGRDEALTPRISSAWPTRPAAAPEPSVTNKSSPTWQRRFRSGVTRRPATPTTGQSSAGS